jgi:hypothetical protein
MIVLSRSKNAAVGAGTLATIRADTVNSAVHRPAPVHSSPLVSLWVEISV